MTSVPLLVLQCQAAKLPRPAREVRFHPVRKWRFDLCWPEYKLAVEVDGGGFVQGRHSRGMGMERDAEKLAEATILGWRVVKVTPRQVMNGKALDWICRLIGGAALIEYAREAKR